MATGELAPLGAPTANALIHCAAGSVAPAHTQLQQDSSQLLSSTPDRRPNLGLEYRYQFFVTRHENRYFRVISQLFGVSATYFPKLVRHLPQAPVPRRPLQEHALPKGRNYNHFP